MIEELEIGRKTIIDDYISLKDPEFYNYYKNNRTHVSKGVERYADWTRAVARIMRSLKTLLLETEGGVYIEKWGYWAIFRTYIKTDKKKKNGNINTFIKNYRYYPYFFGEIDNTTFKNWYMSMTYCDDLILIMKEQIKKGFKYKLFLTTVKGLIRANKETRKEFKK